MTLDLILKDVTDPIIRENFYRIQRYIASNLILGVDFKFIETDIPAASDEFKIPHGLNFTPTDIIPLSAEGDYNYYFRADLSDKQNIYVSANGPVRLRFLVGNFNQTGRRILSDSKLLFVAPNSGGQGPVTPPSGGDNAYTYNFFTPQTTWLVNHNLGYYPSTRVYSTGAAEIVGDVLNLSKNQVQVTFSKPTAGFARLL